MLSNKYAEKLIFGGIYRCSNMYPCDSYGSVLNDQRYGIWVPICYLYTDSDKKQYKKYGMIDTYQIDCSIQYARDDKIDYTNMNKFERIVKNLQELKNLENGNNAKYKTGNYYYSAFCELTNSNFKDFELIANLSDYEVTRNPDYYDKCDVICGVRLYNEHAYPYGINIKKKNAKTNYGNKISSKIYNLEFQCHPPKAIYKFQYNELLNLEKEAKEQGAMYDKKNLDNFIKKNNFLIKQREEYDKFMIELKAETDNE